MANFQYFHWADNVAPNGTPSVGSGTADSAYPITNLTDFSFARLGAPAKLNEVTGAFLIDFGSAQRVDYVVLWHDFDPALAVAVQMHASDSWGAPTMTTSPTVPAKRADGGTVKMGIDMRSVSGYSTGGFRYLRVNVSGSNSVPLGLKVLAFSRVRTTVRNINWGLEESEHQTGILMTTVGLAPWAYDLQSWPRQLVADIEPTDADALAIKEWFRASGGFAKLTLVVKDPSDPDPLLGQWSEGTLGVVAPSQRVLRLGDTHEFLDVHRMRLVLNEVSVGVEWI